MKTINEREIQNKKTKEKQTKQKGARGTETIYIHIYVIYIYMCVCVCVCVFWPRCCGLRDYNGAKNKFMTIFLENSVSISLHFLGIVWIDTLNYFQEGSFFSNNGCHRNRKMAVFQLSYQRFLPGKKPSSKTWTL